MKKVHDDLKEKYPLKIQKCLRLHSFVFDRIIIYYFEVGTMISRRNF